MTHVSLSMEQKQTHRHREQACGCQGERGGRWMDWAFGVSGFELLYREWANNKELLYREWVKKYLLSSRGNSVQYPVINHSGKEYEKECVCAY